MFRNNIQQLNKTSVPQYTIRMQVDSVVTPAGPYKFKLKPYSHFTLGCTSDDRSSEIKDSLDKLARDLHHPVTLKAKSIVCLGS